MNSNERKAKLDTIERCMKVYQAAKLAWLRKEASDDDLLAMVTATELETKKLIGDATDLPENDPRRDTLLASIAMLEAQAGDAELRFRAWARENAKQMRRLS